MGGGLSLDAGRVPLATVSRWRRARPRARDTGVPLREPAPPYRNEGPHALWHVSEDPSLDRFEPHVAPTAAETEPLVWAVDTRHLPFYWFPRDCPRGTFWAHSGSDPEDVRRLLPGSPRVHVVEESWLDRMR